MRKVLNVLAALLVSTCSWASIAAVNGVGNNAASNTTITCTISPTAGHAIVFILFNGGIITSPSVADNNSNALTPGATETGTGQTISVFYGTAVTGATSYIAAWTTARASVCLVEEYSGVGSFNGSLSGNTATATSGSASITVTTQDNNDYNVCGLNNASNNAFTVTVGTSRQTGTQATTIKSLLLDNTVATAGSLSCTATLTSSVWTGASVELRVAASTIHGQFPRSQ